MKSKWLMAGALAAALCLPSCKTHVTTSQPGEHTGTYALTTINGHRLPYTPPHEGGAPEVQSGSITLEDDGTFKSAMSYGFPNGKSGGRDFTGGYTRDGSRFTLRWDGAGTTIATLENDTLTMDNEGVLFAYRK